MLDSCSSQTIFCMCKPRLTSPVLKRMGLGWWHSFVWLDGWPSKASLIPSQKGSPSTAPTCTEIESGYHSPSPQACSPMWAKGQNHLGWSSGLHLHLLFLLQSCDPELVYMCLPEKQTQRCLASMWNRSRKVPATAFLCEAFLPCVHIKKKLTH